MPNQIEEIRQNLHNDLSVSLDSSKPLESINKVYLSYFSKSNGIITQLLKAVSSLSDEEKKSTGALINQFSNEAKQLIQEATIKATQQTEQNNNLIDLTLPQPAIDYGQLHPTTQKINELNSFFTYLGFSLVEGPEIEEAEYNFRKLNLPEGHPATDLQDSLFINEPNILLRTHTSSIETRILTNNKPPIRAVVGGKCYRNETPSATNVPFFYQYQGFVVDKGITIQNLKHTLTQVHKFLFGDDVVLRFRYKYYPEVSPGMGVDLQCKFCKGEGCQVCKHRGWIEVLGCGMIHYNTLKACNIDPEVYTGFAFGLGLDRLTMQQLQLTDIRKFYGGEIVYN